jgi:hydrogenase nickel incorporation protein HypA/HybF
LLAQLAEIAERHGASAVERVTIEVGPLSGIEPELLARAFTILRGGGCAAQALLSIESTTVSISCLGCGAGSAAEPNRLVCAICGSFRTRIIAGDELRLRHLELRVPQSRAALTV